MRVDVELHGIFGAGAATGRTGATSTHDRARARHHMKLLGIIRGRPAGCRAARTAREGHDLRPRDPGEWGRLAGEVAAHARGVDRPLEILNEPDARWAFPGGAEDYARMLSAAYDAIKARAPEAKVVFGGVERPREHEWIDRVSPRRAPTRPRSSTSPPSTSGCGCATSCRRWRSGSTAAPLLQTHGFHGPIWVTEHGYPADPAFQWDPAYRGRTRHGAAEQAALLRRSIPLLAQAGAGQIFVTLRDNLWGEFLSEGIVHVDEAQPSYPATRRPAFERRARARARVGPALYSARGRREQEREAAELRGSARPRARRAAAGRRRAGRERPKAIRGRPRGLVRPPAT